MSMITKLLKEKSEFFTDNLKGIKKLASILIDIKSKNLPHNKNSEEYSLGFWAKGFTTTPIPVLDNEKINMLELKINFVDEILEINFNNHSTCVDISNKNIISIDKLIQEEFKKIRIPDQLKNDSLTDTTDISYNKQDTIIMWDVLIYVYFLFIEFKSNILKETSSINFWPHHFDLAILLFSGRIVEGQDKGNWSYSREQMNFGFIFGDEFIPRPYFYVTIYPFNDEIMKNKLNNNAYWYNEKWKGAILEVDLLNEGPNQKKAILSFFDQVRNLAPNQFYND